MDNQPFYRRHLSISCMVIALVFIVIVLVILALLGPAMGSMPNPPVIIKQL